MKRRSVLAVMMVLAISLCGCGSGKGNDKKDSPPIRESREEQTVENDWSISKRETDTGENAEENEEKNRRLDRITYTYQCHPVEADHVRDMIVTGNYHTIKLDEDIRDKYPELEKVTEKYNSGSHEKITDFIEGSREEILEMRKEGFTGYYEYDIYLYPVRADEKVFSFVQEEYTFLGGAHGSTVFSGYNYDPLTGRELEFDDVVKDTSNLPQIIFEELKEQNPDLEDYFDEMSSDKDDLMKGIPNRLEANAKGLAWALDYDGIRINFEDYAMGSYAAGARSLKIRFKDHPEIFTDRYTDYENGREPVIDNIAVKLEDAGKEIISSGDDDKKRISEDRDEPKGANIIKLDREDQYKLNLFISNFAEQGFRFYDEEEKIDIAALTDFAYMWTKINKYRDIEMEGSYYKVSIDKVKSIVDKYFGIRLSDDELYGYDWSKSEHDTFCKGGYYYVPAADGETYTGLAIVEQAEDMGDGTLWLYFTTFNLDLDVYWDSDDGISKKYYSMSFSEALNSKDLETGYGGMAIVRKEGDSYKLKYYKIY